ncbi:MAG: RNA polymerase sigma factor [Alphaproteobacteria bacterium]
MTDESTSDEILMAAYLAGSEQAFRTLHDRHAPGVYGFLVRRVSDPAIADDLYQEAFLRVHRARATWDPERPFRPWLFGIVHHLLTDHLRERGRSQERPDEDAVARASTASEPVPGLGAPPPDPERAAERRESTEALDRALRALPEDEATVLILARVEGLPYEEIGPILGRSPAAAKQLAYRALKRLRTELENAGHGGMS